MAGKEHGRIIAEAAKSALQPVGFKRKGQSRVWIADEGFWLSVVEFQPSARSKGTYLNVAVHWPWGRPPHMLTYDQVGREGDFINFENPEQFGVLAAGLAGQALTTVKRNRANFGSLPGTAAILIEEERSSDVYRGGWATFNAGVAAGLAGMHDEARSMFGSINEAHAQPLAELLLNDIAQPDVFEARVRSMIDAERSHFRLELLDNLLSGYAA